MQADLGAAAVLAAVSVGNDLTAAPAGCYEGGDGAAAEPDTEVDVTARPTILDGHDVCAARFLVHDGYPNNATTGVAVGDETVLDDQPHSDGIGPEHTPVWKLPAATQDLSPSAEQALRARRRQLVLEGRRLVGRILAPAEGEDFRPRALSPDVSLRVDTHLVSPMTIASLQDNHKYAVSPAS